MFLKDPLKYNVLCGSSFIVKVKKLTRSWIIPNQVFKKEVAQITDWGLGH